MHHTPPPRLIPLDRIDTEPVGGKAAQLAQLVRLGLRVPEGFVIVGAAPGRLPPELDEYSRTARGCGGGALVGAGGGQRGGVVRRAVRDGARGRGRARDPRGGGTLSCIHGRRARRGVSQRDARAGRGEHGGGGPAHGGRHRSGCDLHRRSGHRPARSHRHQCRPGTGRGAGGWLPHARSLRSLPRGHHSRAHVAGRARRRGRGEARALGARRAEGRGGTGLSAGPRMGHRTATIKSTGCRHDPSRRSSCLGRTSSTMWWIPTWQLTSHNVAEWMPGAMPPLSWSVVGPSYIRAMNELYVRAGVPRDLVESVPMPRERPGARVHQHVELLPARRADVRHGQRQLRSHAHRPGTAARRSSRPTHRSCSGWCIPLRYFRLVPAGRKRLDAFVARYATFRVEPDRGPGRVLPAPGAGGRDLQRVRRCPRPYLDDGDCVAGRVPAIAQQGRAADPEVPCRGRGAAGRGEGRRLGRGCELHRRDGRTGQSRGADSGASRERQSASRACRRTRRWNGCETHPPARRARRSRPSWSRTDTAASASWISASATGRRILCR